MARHPEESAVRTSPGFRQRMLELLEDADCTKVALAAAIGVSKEVVFRAVDYGIVPSVRSLIKIADYANSPIDWVLGKTDERYFQKSDAPQTFQQRLELLRAEKGIRYSELVKNFPFPANAFYEWRRTGGLPCYEYLALLARFFDVSLDYLLGRTDDRNF